MLPQNKHTTCSMPHTQRQTNSLLGRQDGQMLKMKPRRPLFKTSTSLYLSTKTMRGDRVETVEDFAGNDHHRQLRVL